MFDAQTDGLFQEVISRDEASDLGLKKYFTGKPCKYGHVSQRYVKGHLCVACARGRYEQLKHKDEKVSSLEEAIYLGRATYFTGVPCRKGHMSERTVRYGRCIACVREYNEARRARKGESRILEAMIEARAELDRLERTAAPPPKRPSLWRRVVAAVSAWLAYYPSMPHPERFVPPDSRSWSIREGHIS